MSSDIDTELEISKALAIFADWDIPETIEDIHGWEEIKINKIEKTKDILKQLIKDTCEKVIGKDETRWTDHWGEEHNSITNDMSSRNSLRSKQRESLQKKLGEIKL